MQARGLGICLVAHHRHSHRSRSALRNCLARCAQSPPFLSVHCAEWTKRAGRPPVGLGAWHVLANGRGERLGQAAVRNELRRLALQMSPLLADRLHVLVHVVAGHVESHVRAHDTSGAVGE